MARNRHDHEPPSVVSTILVGSGPSGVAVTPDGKHVYVTNASVGSPFGTVSVIDTATNMAAASGSSYRN
jgi:YVTN family beta-propeller protein